MEENNVEDQGQEVSETTEETSSEGQTSEEQSEATKDVQEEAKTDVFRDHLGRELTAEQLHQEYLKTQKYVTELEQTKAQREAEIQDEAARAVSGNELLQNVDPNVKEAIQQIVTPVIQDALKQRDEAEARKAQDAALRSKFDNAEKKYDGKNGYPKFERTKVTNYMLENEVYDPERAYLLMNQSAIIDAEVRKAMKGGKASTESTGSPTPRKPQGDSPKTWEEAAKRATSRV
jgi:ribosomal protein L17